MALNLGQLLSAPVAGRTGGVKAGTGITIAGDGTLNLGNTGVTAGVYPTPQSLSINAQGQITSATAATGAVAAWANFDGAGAGITVRGSGNVSSISRVSNGVYSVSMSTALNSPDYAISGSVSQNGVEPGDDYFSSYPISTTVFQCASVNTTGGSFENAIYVMPVVTL